MLALQAEERRANEEQGLRHAEEMGSWAGNSESGGLTFESDSEARSATRPSRRYGQASSSSALSGLFNAWMGDEAAQTRQRHARRRKQRRGKPNAQAQDRRPRRRRHQLCQRRRTARRRPRRQCGGARLVETHIGGPQLVRLNIVSDTPICPFSCSSHSASASFQSVRQVLLSRNVCLSSAMILRTECYGYAKDQVASDTAITPRPCEARTCMQVSPRCQW
ncbi:hypothetical protein L1887_57176 [Cichorium endivia]|nr:hypothetical protein L1887_57176 [Cichorium endivia]